VKVLVTGGAGFIGSNIAFKLKENGFKVLVLDNLKRRGSEFNIGKFKKYNIEFIHGDIRNKEDLNLKFDFMIEASADPSVLSSINNIDYLLSTNLIGGINCVNMCLKNKANLIFLSTSRVYSIHLINSLKFEETDTRYNLSQNRIKGVTLNGFTEDFSTKGIKSLYGTSKLSLEMIIEEFCYFNKLGAVINRCGVVTGPGQFGKAEQGFFTHWIASYVYNKPLYITGNGKQVRDILHVDDLSDLILFQINNFEKFNNKIFNVGGGIENSISILELNELCRENFGKKIITFKRAEELDIKYYVSDNMKISKYFTPKKNIYEIFNDTLEWVKENKWIFV
jgi:CDP-paratose 2-epimerase